MPQTWERTLRAVSASGEVDWLMTAPGVPLMGDMFGGVVAGVEPAPHQCFGPAFQTERCYTALTRFAGPAATASWRYDSPGLVDRPAQGPDGTIYVLEHVGDYLYYPNDPGLTIIGEKSVVIIDGATGAVTARVPLASNASHEPVTVGPIVGGDGFGYILVTNGMQITLRRLSRDGQVASETIVNGTCTTNCTGPTPYQLLPDGIGGLLITANWSVSSQAPFDLRLTRLDGAGGRTDTPIAGVNSPGGLIELIGQAGTAYLRVTSGATTVSQPVMDIATWTPRWSLPIEWTLLAASPDGGAVARNAAGDLARFDGTGQLLGTTPSLGLRNPVQESGGWVGNSTSGLHSVAGRFDDATYWNATDAKVLWSSPEQYGQGNRQQNLAPPGYFSNYNAIDLLTNQTPTEVFNQFVRNFGGLAGNTVVSAAPPPGGITGIGQTVTFTLRNPVYSILQPPFSVESIRLDAANHVMSVKTLPGHPLFGWRFWKVIQSGTGRIRVETGAVDKPAPGTPLGYWWSSGDQIGTWFEYLQRIRAELGAVQDLSVPDASRRLQGVWNYDKTYIMTQVCGSTPALTTWACQ